MNMKKKRSPRSQAQRVSLRRFAARRAAARRPAEAGEIQVPRYALVAFAAAARTAQREKLPYMEIVGSELRRVTADGTRTFIKHVAPDVPMKVGQKITLR